MAKTPYVMTHALPTRRALGRCEVVATPNRILVVEDDTSLREVLSAVLEHSGFSVTPQPDAESALVALQTGEFECVLADFKLPKKNGIELLRATREITAHTPFIIMTAYGSIGIAVEAMKNGANDFVTKPFNPDSICDLIRQVIEHRRIVDRATGNRGRRARTVMTDAPVMREILSQASKVARVDTSVLILGESGTGKELLARYIHEHSPRASKPFLGVNCAALPPDLLESEFFGHEAGAFTGATQSRVGVFELAAEGTLFLDEIGDMAPALQVKILRAVQEREIKRVGGAKMIKASPRIIAATNRDVNEALAAGTLREDLFFRLAVVTFTLPPLRERHGDIVLLAEYYRDLFCGQMGKNARFEPSALKALNEYSWPGNARELENVMERAVILADTTIRPEHLGISPALNISSIDDATRSLHEVASTAARAAEVELIKRVLSQTGGNKSRAAKLLGVSYKTLLSKVREYHLESGRVH